MGRSARRSRSLLSVLCLLGAASLVAGQCNPNDPPQLFGFCNNINNTMQGAATQSFRRGPEGFEFEDGISTPVLAGRPNMRRLSVALGSPNASAIDTNFSLNMFGVVFGQFITHDVAGNRFDGDITHDLRVQVEDHNDLLCKFPTQASDRCGGAGIFIPVQRSLGAMDSGHFEVFNDQTSYLDLSIVYGVADSILNSLRPNGNTCKLSTQMFNMNGVSILGLIQDPTSMNNFKAGDGRVNENIGLAMFQVLFALEHNRWCDALAPTVPEGAGRFQAARKMAVAVFQHIVFNEYIPAELGSHIVSLLGDYKGYNASLDATTSYVFTDAAFRFAHSALRSYTPVGADNVTIPRPVQNLGRTDTANTAVQMIAAAGGFESLIRGMLNTRPHPITTAYDAVLRDGLTTDGGNDLWVIDVARARLNGLPNFARVKAAWRPDAPIYGADGCAASLATSSQNDPIECFLAATDGDNTTATLLMNAYGKVNRVDCLVGMLAEKKVDGTRLGETASVVIADQFHRYREGDRFWYEAQGWLTESQLAQVKNRTMSALLRDNFSFRATDVFQLPESVFAHAGSV